MKFLAIEKEVPGKTTENFQPYLKNEAEHVYSLIQKDIVREIYFNQKHNAVLILECESMEVARETLNDFPLVKNKIIEFEIMVLIPYSGLERLFGKN
jgi:hypothetical protein